MSKKLIALTLAVAFALPFVAPAQAATVEELQALINSLNQQIAALQQQLASLTGGSASTGTYCFTTDLKKGMTSNDVKNLQIVLNKDAATQVATTGAGSPGNETTYFGALTEAAVKKYQAANGISPVSGYVGPLTRASLNAKYCNPVTPPTTAPSETTTTTIVAPAYGTLSVTEYSISNPQSTWYGAQTYEVLAGQYKATGSDITLRKVALKITSPTFPWSALSTISLWDGSTKLTEVAVTQANLIQNTFGTDYTLNISGFTWVIPNGQTKVLTVKATTAPVIASASAGTYGFTLLDSSVYTDTAGITYTSGVGTVGPKSYTMNASTQAAGFVVSVNTNNPLENNVIGSTTNTTKQTVLVFNVQNNSTVNATFNSATSSIKLSTSTPIVISLELWDGDNMIQSAAVPATDTLSTITWQNFTLPIAANTTKTLTIKAVIAQLTSGYAGGDTVKVSGPVLTGIDANSNLVHADGSSITGNTQHIYYKAPSFAYVTSDAKVTGSDPNNGKINDIADTSITFTITANNSDIFIDSATGTTSKILLLSTTSTPSDTLNCNNPADNTTYPGYWRIPQGNTATCVLTSHLTNTGATAGFAAIQLDKIYWNTTSAFPASPQSYGFTTFKTGTFYLGK